MAPSHANLPTTNKYLTLIDMGKVTKCLMTTELETCASFLGRSDLHTNVCWNISTVGVYCNKNVADLIYCSHISVWCYYVGSEGFRLPSGNQAMWVQLQRGYRVVPVCFDPTTNGSTMCQFSCDMKLKLDISTKHGIVTPYDLRHLCQHWFTQRLVAIPNKGVI